MKKGNPSIKYGIISAGEGSRLAQEGVATAKPLVRIGGEAMIDRLLRIFSQQGAAETAVIVNRKDGQTAGHMQQIIEKNEMPISLVVADTPSSLHSFSAISKYLREGPSCITTVDTIFREEEFGRLIEAFRQSDADGMMAVTDYIDDEKPLYVATNPSTMDITGFYDIPMPEVRFISGGIYCLTPRCMEVLDKCMAEGMARMRNFQRALVAEGLRLKAFPFSKILDVDHASDIAKAEQFLNNPS